MKPAGNEADRNARMSVLARISLLTLFPMGYFPTDFPWEVVAASPAYANDFLNFLMLLYKIC